MMEKGLLAKKLPDLSGIYMMKDSAGEVLYVGKAKSLAKRVKSYFNPKRNDIKISTMIGQVKDIDFIVTSNELEAYVLESNLIKQLKPKYNVVLKDDKHYPYLKLTVKEDFPRLLIVRKIKKDGNMYFGPYVGGRAVRKTLRLIYKVFGIRQSKDVLQEGKTRRPCINYQMNRCTAPCAGFITRSEYSKIIDSVIMFLKGKGTDLLRRLKSEMNALSLQMKYESAARIRDQITALEQVMQTQHIISTGGEEQDIIAISHAEGYRRIPCLPDINGQEDGSGILIFFIRGGMLIGNDRISLFNYQYSNNEEELISSFIKQYYSSNRYIPKEIIIELDIHERGLVEQWLSNSKGENVRITVPKMGRKRRLLNMAVENARYMYMMVKNKSNPALNSIKDVLHIEKLPIVIDAIDISNISGKMAVGACVVYIDGYPAKEHYRRYKIKEIKGTDDYGMLREVISRRYSKALSYDCHPDIIVIDGGKGQLNSVKDVLGVIKPELNKIISIAKGKERHKIDTHIFYFNNNEVHFDFTSLNARNLLLEIRDEAHRFAVSYHRKVRLKQGIGSILDSIHGIGKKRKGILINHFGSVEGIKNATVEEIAKLLSISDDTALRIVNEMKVIPL